MPAGRPSQYVKEYHVPWAKSLARRGLTVKQIANEIGVAKSTFCKWVAENQELSDALKEGRDIADSKVEDSLYRKAIGYTYTERKTIVSADGEGGQKPARVEMIEKEVPPDVTACIFWLQNRKPYDWRDQRNIVLKSSDDDDVRKEIAAIVNDVAKRMEDHGSPSSNNLPDDQAG